MGSIEHGDGELALVQSRLRRRATPQANSAVELGRDCSVLIPGRKVASIFVARSQKVMQRVPVWKTLACAVGTDLG